jgi:hypothetical protein
MVAGIVLAAFGLETILGHVDRPLDSVHSFALLGGTAIYLLAHVLLRLRNARTLNVQRLALALLLLALVVPATHVDPLLVAGGLDALLWAMILYETVRIYGDSRYHLRHDDEITLPEDHRAQETDR